MKVFKFGGASIETTDRARNMACIVEDYANDKLLVVVSAKGKTTNKLEQIAHFYTKGNTLAAREALNELMQDHLAYANELLGSHPQPVIDQLETFFAEMHWVLDEPVSRSLDYYYDQIVGVGELLSTAIINAYLQQKGLKSIWVDIRDTIKTDSTYRDAKIDWKLTQTLVQKNIQSLWEHYDIVITQGFIGSTDENNTVTLGREGSDYTAALLANMLDAQDVSIWKDVPSLLNADPKIFPNTVPIEEITYREVIEMSYYGAQIIHPKTIKPLQNKDIPLYVKCFLDKSKKGTLIHNTLKTIVYPPLMVLKMDQVLLQVSTKDYSFITEDNLSNLYSLFHECKIKINLIQNAAISFVACVDYQPEKIDQLLQKLQKNYDVKRNENLYLFTVRHYNQAILKEELKNRTVLLTQKTRQTIQLVAI